MPPSRALADIAFENAQRLTDLAEGKLKPSAEERTAAPEWYRAQAWQAVAWLHDHDLHDEARKVERRLERLAAKAPA